MIRGALRGTPAMRAEGRPGPVPVYTTEQQLKRMRHGLFVALGGEFILSEAVGLIADPLGARIAADETPGRFIRRQKTPPTSHLVNYPRSEAPGVEEVADAVHALIHVAAGVVAEREARRRTVHLSGADRDRAVRHLADLAQRPLLPAIDSENLVSGDWPTVLVALAASYDAALAEALGSARTADVSDRVVTALRDADRVAASLHRRLDRAAAVRADCPRPMPQTATVADAPAPTDEQRRAELAALGVRVD